MGRSRMAPDIFDSPSEIPPSQSPPFAAGFDSECAWCPEDIEEGDMIVMRDGEVIHESCALKEDDPFDEAKPLSYPKIRRSGIEDVPFDDY